LFLQRKIFRSLFFFEIYLFIYLFIWPFFFFLHLLFSFFIFFIFHFFIFFFFHLNSIEFFFSKIICILFINLNQNLKYRDNFKEHNMNNDNQKNSRTWVEPQISNLTSVKKRRNSFQSTESSYSETHSTHSLSTVESKTLYIVSFFFFLKKFFFFFFF